MPRLSRFPPYPRKQHSSGQARIKLRGRPYYLGAFGSPASWAEYRRLLAEWERGHAAPRPRRDSRIGAVNELLAAYGEFAATYYVKDGRQTDQVERVNRSLGFVRDLYGPRPIDAFDQAALDLVRSEMIRSDYSRVHVNQCVGCIRRAWKWAAARQLIPIEHYQRLCLLEDLKRGRSPARESKPVPPVPAAIVAKTLPFLMPPPAAMVRLQLLTGMRPGEVVQMRPGDLDRSGPTWIYQPQRHKGEHRGQGRQIYLGPRAQAILRPFLHELPADDEGVHQLLANTAQDEAAYAPLADRLAELGCLLKAQADCLFSPREAMDWQTTERRRKRRTKVYGSERRRVRHPRRRPRESYPVESYGRAIARACQMAGVPHWHAHQLRHTAATRIRTEFGPDAARAALGHRSLGATQIYAEVDGEKVADMMRRIG